MRKNKIITLLICTLVLLLCAFAQFGMTANAAASTTSGYCGAEGAEKSVKWSYKSGTLTISGKGAIADYRYIDENGSDQGIRRPWQKYINLIKSLVIGEGITEIGSDAFLGFSKLEKVQFPKSLEYIGNFAFADCVSLGNFTLPENLEGLGQQCFDGCVSLTKLKIPDNVTFIDSQICHDCTGLTSVYIGGKKDTGYMHSFSLFQGCTSLTKIEVSPDNVGLMAKDNVLYTKDGTKLIAYPAGRTEKVFRIPEGVRVLEFGSMSSCKLTGIILPSTMEIVESYAFEHTDNLLYIKNNSNKTFDLDGATFYDGGDRVVHKLKAKQTVYTKQKSIALGCKKFTYNGKNKRPEVIVKNGAGQKLEAGVDYTVSYPKQSANVGTYNVKITFKGNYSGSKTLNYTIYPAAPSKVTSQLYGYKNIKVSWTKVTGATAYRVYYKKASAKQYILWGITTNLYKKVDLQKESMYLK